MLVTDAPIPVDLAALIASRFAALAEPTRVRILDLLRRDGELSVGEIAERLGGGYANVAKHLGLLHRERIVGRTKHGTRVMYRIVDDSVLALCEDVCGAIEQQHAELTELLSGRQFTAAMADPHEEKSR
jgi:DNA-binding transcriptional ArsR family regulator